MDYRELDWRVLRPLLPPKDRYWGDPFVISRDELLLRLHRGEALRNRPGPHRVPDAGSGRPARYPSKRVLERPYHLSYPFIFEQGGDLFMIPETAGHRTVELYRCTHFPERWEFVRDLMTDIYAVDATLLEYRGQVLVVCQCKGAGRQQPRRLKSLLRAISSRPGTGHLIRRNPIVHDIRPARPAGRIFLQEGKLIRPRQNSSRRYGYALRFNRDHDPERNGLRRGARSQLHTARQPVPGDPHIQSSR